jgi:hypothetical protein
MGIEKIEKGKGRQTAMAIVDPTGHVDLSTRMP